MSCFCWCLWTFGLWWAGHSRVSLNSVKEDSLITPVEPKQIRRRYLILAERRNGKKQFTRRNVFAYLSDEVQRTSIILADDMRSNCPRCLRIDKIEQRLSTPPCVIHWITVFYGIHENSTINVQNSFQFFCNCRIMRSAFSSWATCTYQLPAILTQQCVIGIVYNNMVVSSSSSSGHRYGRKFSVSPVCVCSSYLHIHASNHLSACSTSSIHTQTHTLLFDKPSATSLMSSNVNFSFEMPHTMSFLQRIVLDKWTKGRWC